MATEKIIEIQPINVVHATITIQGDGDLVLNKMNAPTIRALTEARKNKAKKIEKPDEWEQIITSMHWRDGTPTDFSEEGLRSPRPQRSLHLRIWDEEVFRAGRCARRAGQVLHQI